MAALEFPALLTKSESGWLVSFPDLPEALTFGASEQEALTAAADCLREAMRGRIRDDENIPIPTTDIPGARMIAVESVMAKKVDRYTRNLSRARAL